MSLALYSDAEAVIQRLASSEIITTTSNAVLLENVYDIQRSIDWLEAGRYAKVALQLPDEMLSDAAAIAQKLEHGANVETFILADTCYNSCCVDEVGAEHLPGIDSIIHYGHACLSPTGRLPVLYVFGQRDIDVSNCVEQLQNEVAEPNSRILLLIHVCYQHVSGDVTVMLRPTFKNLVVAEPHYMHACVPEEKPGVTTFIKFGRIFQLEEGVNIKDHTVLYVGPREQTLVNFMMVLSGCSFISYDPTTRSSCKESISVNRLLMKRYYLVEKARDASCVGILVGTLAVQNYMGILNRLRYMLRLAGKKTYTFVVGKLNVAKLANFPEIDIYVHISCAENTMISSEQKFYQPIVTPYEMEVACLGSRCWTGDVIMDFSELLPGGSAHIPMNETECSSERIDVSLVSGNIRCLGLSPEDHQLARQETSLVPVNRPGLLAPQVTGDSLEIRSWKGLESENDAMSTEKALEGRHGIAAGYNQEGSS